MFDSNGCFVAWRKKNTYDFLSVWDYVYKTICNCTIKFVIVRLYCNQAIKILIYNCQD